MHEITQMLLELLKVDDQQSNTKIWIIDALDKISSCGDFGMHQEVKGILEEHSLSDSLQLAVRSIGSICSYTESRRLGKYNSALRHADDLVFDPNLTFLQGFVAAQKTQGAKDYDDRLSISTVDQTSEYNVKPYINDSQGKTVTAE